MIKLDCNEAPFDLPIELKQEALSQLLKSNWSRYPNVNSAPLRAQLSAINNWPQDQIFIGNGSDELLQALFIGLGALFDTVVIPSPTFGMYKLLAQRFGKLVKEIVSSAPDFVPNIGAIKAAVEDSRTLLFICQPNNPTGRAWITHEVDEVTKASQGIVVIDQAYGEFCNPVPKVTPVGERSIVIRTFSKAFGAAGLRLGYAFASSDLADRLTAGLLPYNVNTLTQTLATYYLEQRSVVVEESIAQVINARGKLFASLVSIGEVEPLNSQANFILFKVRRALKVWEELCAQGIYVRRFAEPQLENYLRVTVGLLEENERFVAALREILRRMAIDD
ncbi:MAG: histidinol-phosphate transaminase [Bacillota bacterium]|nr:histidinol-phosphate transaminase [Bacillota bacterium]